MRRFRSPDPAQDGRLIKVTDFLDRAGERLDTEFEGSQAVRGKLLEALGRMYWSLGLVDRSVSLHTRPALARPPWIDTPRRSVRQYLAIAYYSVGRCTSGSRCIRRCSRCGGEAGPRSSRDAYHATTWPIPTTASAGCRGDRLHEATLRLREAKLGPDHPETLSSRDNLANVYAYADGSRRPLPGTRRHSSGRRPGWARTTLKRSRPAGTLPVYSLGRGPTPSALFATCWPDSQMKSPTVPIADDLAVLVVILIEQRWSEAEPPLPRVGDPR